MAGKKASTAKAKATKKVEVVEEPTPEVASYIVPMFFKREPMEKAVKEGQLCAYKHNGFWQCMDTKRDRDNLEEIYSKGAPWLKID